ncbi:MAG TPA: hypothetical protein VFU63_00485 [Ktedonobacterales bacterium]|nr:hypothetical protein [Ktedonobacterales bacterium]
MRSKASSGNIDHGTGRLNRSQILRLCAALFGTTPIAAPCHTWAIESPRFAAFLDAYQGKIGKKLRGITDNDGYLDLLAELDVAHRLLADRGFTLVYEPYLAEHQRGPDFGVTFKTHTPFTIEVRHLRPSATDVYPRLAAVLAEKLRQLPASTPNVLVVKNETGSVIAPEHLQAALNALTAPAQQRDDAASRRRGFADARDVLRRIERLSAIAVLDAPPVLFEHPRARHVLSADLRKALARVLA